MNIATRHLKANSRGSWTNVLSFAPAREAEVRTAAMALRAASGETVSFKITDDAGNTLATLPGAGKRTGNYWGNSHAS